jgi:hypothetical protein
VLLECLTRGYSRKERDDEVALHITQHIVNKKARKKESKKHKKKKQKLVCCVLLLLRNVLHCVLCVVCAAMSNVLVTMFAPAKTTARRTATIGFDGRRGTL